MTDFTVRDFVGRFPLFLLGRSLRSTTEKSPILAGNYFTVRWDNLIALAVFTDADLAVRALEAINLDAQGGKVVRVTGIEEMVELLELHERQGAASFVTFDPDFSRERAREPIPISEVIEAFEGASGEQHP
jgi:hypothetical protein